MKRLTILAALIVGALAFAVAGLADPGGHDKKKSEKVSKSESEHSAKPDHSKFTFNMTTTDNGSCGNAWANDTEKRTYTVKDNHDGTFNLRRTEKGTFTTLAGQSPGACETKGKHGHTVLAGVVGKFEGFLEGTVTASSFNPNATCAAGADCSSRAGFIATYFAPGATYSCDQNSTDCKFNFNYTASAKHHAQKNLLYRHWQDKGKGAGTLLHEDLKGDIANA
jgi:hypothetical protein